jgi:hypothetical protein
MLGYYIIIRKITDNIIKNFNHLNIILYKKTQSCLGLAFQSKCPRKTS